MNESTLKNYSETSSSIVVIVNLVTNVLLIGNSLVLTSIFTSSSLRSRPSMILLCSLDLQISDLAVRLIVSVNQSS